MQIEQFKVDQIINDVILDKDIFSLRSINNDVAHLTLHSISHYKVRDITLRCCYNLMLCFKIKKYEYEKVNGQMCFKIYRNAE